MHHYCCIFVFVFKDKYMNYGFLDFFVLFFQVVQNWYRVIVSSSNWVVSRGIRIHNRCRIFFYLGGIFCGGSKFRFPPYIFENQLGRINMSDSSFESLFYLDQNMEINYTSKINFFHASIIKNDYFT